MECTLKDSFQNFIKHVTDRQEKGREISRSLSLFLGIHFFCTHIEYFIMSICLALARLDIFSLCSNSICFRFAQTRYDINPRSRSEHIERSSAHRALKAHIERRRRISKIRVSGFISMRSVLKDTTLRTRPFYAKICIE